MKSPRNNSKSQAGRRARRLFAFTILSRTFWITGFGFGSIVMALLLGAAAFNTGTNLLYVMLSLLFALFTLSVVLGWLNLNGLTIKRIAPGEIHVGQTGEIQVMLKNSKRWMSSYGVSVEERVKGASPETLASFFMTVPARGTVLAQAPVSFERRGIHRLEGVRLGTLFPFGLLEFRSRQANHVEFIVYPEIVPVKDPPKRLTRGAGDDEHPEKGRASGLHSIREYAPGDPARDIHWRLSAKGTGIKVREYESESAEGVQLVLDVGRQEMKTAEDAVRLEQAISLTASLAHHYIRERIEVMVWTAAGVVPRGIGPVHLKRILRSLALLEVEDLKPHAVAPRPPLDMTQLRIKGPAIGSVDVRLPGTGRSSAMFREMDPSGRERVGAGIDADLRGG